MTLCKCLIWSVTVILLAIGCSCQKPMEVIVSTNAAFNALAEKLPSMEMGTGEYHDMHDVKNTALRNAHCRLFKIAADDRTDRLVRGELPPVKQWELIAKWWQLMDSESKRLGMDRQEMLLGYEGYVGNSRYAFRIGKALGRYTDKDIKDICDYLEPYMGFRLTPNAEGK